MYQQVFLVGNLGKDPEMRYTPDGKAVCSLSVAVNAGKDKTLWVTVATWEKLAESCNQYLKKGTQVVISGELSEPYAYIGKEDGQAHARLEVVARVVKFGRGVLMAPYGSQNMTSAPEAVIETDVPF